MIKSHKVTRTYESDVIDSVTCDMCKHESGRGGWADDDFHHHIETSVSYRDYTSYPEDTYTDEEITFDICPDCFKKRLLPWMKSQGAEPRITGNLYD